MLPGKEQERRSKNLVSFTVGRLDSADANGVTSLSVIDITHVAGTYPTIVNTSVPVSSTVQDYYKTAEP